MRIKGSDINAPSGVIVVELVDRQHVGSHTQVQVLQGSHLQHLVCCRRHHLFEPTVDDVLLLGALQQRFFGMGELAVVDLGGLLDDLKEVLLGLLLPLHHKRLTLRSRRPHLTCSMFFSHSK
jgi:hypothetical protein